MIFIVTKILPYEKKKETRGLLRISWSTTTSGFDLELRFSSKRRRLNGLLISMLSMASGYFLSI